MTRYRKPGYPAVAMLIALLLSLSSGVVASRIDTGLLRVGEGVLSWWGITVYRASLYAPSGQFHPERPHALRIDYELGFSREELAQSSLEQIERMHGELPDRAAVLAQLSDVLVDVRSGDRIVGVHLPGEGAEFYDKDQLIGRLEDPQLAQRFFAIWLDPATAEPRLRNRLLGVNR